MKETKYKKWAFKLLIYLIIINVLVAYLVMNFAVGFHDAGRFEQNIGILSLVANLILIIGIIFTILSIKNKEGKNYQYYFSVIGYPIFLVLTLLSLF
ncbi:hypothetical protein [Tenacibaculum halocynthiae]|uniref:hypothetical protein n=1 Tax=Tenacibaculum halocynthiae TaxID=1254437 RepID=UPI003D652EA8